MSESPFKLGRYPAVNYETVTLERMRYHSRTILGEELSLSLNPTVTTYMDHRLRGLVMEIKAAVWAKKLGMDDYRWPATWWDAVKERFSPRWFLARYPVDYRGVTVEAYHTYPTLNIQHHQPHLQFIVHGYEER